MLNLENFNLIYKNINNSDYDIDEIFMELIVIYESYIDTIKNEFTETIKQSGIYIFNLLKEIYINDRFNEDIFDEDHELLNKKILNKINFILDMFDTNENNDIIIQEIINFNSLLNNTNKDEDISMDTLTKINNSLIINKIYKRIENQKYPLSEDDIDFYNKSIDYINYILDNEFDKELVEKVMRNKIRKNGINFNNVIINKINNEQDEDTKENKELSDKFEIDEYLEILLHCQSMLDRHNHIDV